jgi:hypothetical protein
MRQPGMLVEVDNRPIRRSYTARLRRARRAITRLETQMARYYQIDSPAFYLWYHREFGPILAHHRGLREQIAACESADSAGNAGNAGNAGGAENAGSAENADSDENDGNDENDENDDGRSRKRQTLSAKRECQRLFRRIALQLHPDRGGPLVGDRKLWWLQAQSAYETGDLVALRLILSRCTPPRRTVAMSCAEILELIQETRDRAEALIGLRARLRRESGWRFTAKSERARASLRIRLARELARIERALIDRLRQVASTPNRWIEECETI